MEKPAFNAKTLLTKYREGTCTDQEQALVERWYDQMRSGSFDVPEDIAEADLEAVWLKLKRKKKAGLWLTWQRLGAAAALFLIVGFAVYICSQKETAKEVLVQEISASNVTPGTDKAMLTLTNGQKIALDEANNGVIATDAGARISKTTDGRIIYSAAGHNATAQNTIETARGGQYQISLPDGTKVWLNAASSLKYPVQFSGKERKVALKGEAYFEVAKDRAHPFIVETDGQVVKVLGTHFNINSYGDDGRTVTTLEEGSIRLTLLEKSYTKTNVQLKPGQQAIRGKSNFQVQKANLETALAWKNGRFEFEDAGIREIMDQVSRWYNIDIEYSGAIPTDLFTGGMSRKSNLSALLKIFQMSSIKFRLEEVANKRKLIISP